MKPNVLSGMVIALLAGIVFTAICLAIFRKKKSASRIVDFINFVIGGIGLVSFLLAIGSYDRRLEQINRLENLVGASFQTLKKVRAVLDDKCKLDPKPNDLNQSGDPKVIECLHLRTYAASLLDLDYTRGVILPTPQFTPLPQSAEALKAYFSIEEIVEDYNDQARTFFSEEIRNQFSNSVIDDIVTIIYAAYALSFAFGMGIVRRIFDMYVDLKPAKAIAKTKKKRPPKNIAEKFLN